MGTEYTGKIKKAFEKNGRFSFLMDDDNWYGLGRLKPQLNNGEAVTDGDDAKFEYEMNGKYRNVIEATLKTRAGELTEAMKNESKGKGGGKSGGGGYQADKAAREKYWADKEARDIQIQRTISYAGALNTATAIITVALNSETIKVGGKANAKLDTLTAMINELAGDIFRGVQSVPVNYDEIMAGGAKTAPVKTPDDMEAPDDDGFNDAPTQSDAGDDDGW